MIYAVGKKTNLRNYILLIASLVFYTWGEPLYVLILIAMTFIDWLSALLIQNVCEKSRIKKNSSPRNFSVESRVALHLFLFSGDGVNRYT